MSECSLQQSAGSKESQAVAAVLTRKERHKLKQSARLQRQLDQISRQSATANSVDRHPLRNVGGSFWKKRKEQKARTLFFGNLPSTYSTGNVNKLVAETLEYLNTSEPKKLEGIEGIVNEEGRLQNVVEHVDFVKFQRRRAPSRSAYVLFISLPIATIIQQALDGYQIFTPEGNGRTSKKTSLRVNFSDDKAQRAEAIQRREQQPKSQQGTAVSSAARQERGKHAVGAGKKKMRKVVGKRQVVNE